MWYDIVKVKIIIFRESFSTIIFYFPYKLCALIVEFAMVKFMFMCKVLLQKSKFFPKKWAIYQIAIFVLFTFIVHRKDVQDEKQKINFTSYHTVVTKDILRDLMQLKINRTLKCCRIKTNMMKPHEELSSCFILLWRFEHQITE